MAALDFKEIPMANKGSGEQDHFELFARDFFAFMGYKILAGPDRGIDGGRDLILEETRTGVGGDSKVKWLVSCKHTAHSGKSVRIHEEKNILDRVTSNSCNGFIGFYSMLPSSGLTNMLDGLKDRIESQIYDSGIIERNLLNSPKGTNIVMRYLPKSFEKWQNQKSRPARFQELTANAFDTFLYGIRPRHTEHDWFAGRSREIKEFNQFLKNEHLILYYYGVSGVGKSWLLNQLLRELSITGTDPDNYVAYVDCKEINGDLLKFIDAIAHDIGGVRLPSYISKRNDFLANSAAEPLSQLWVDDLSDSLFHDLKVVSMTERVVLFIDSFEKVQGTTLGNKILTALNNHFCKRFTNGFKVVIVSQSPQDPNHLRGEQIEVMPFSREELEEFAEKNLGTTESAVIDSLVFEWKADPLTVGQLEGQYNKIQNATSADHMSQLSRLLPKCIATADSEFIDRLQDRIGPEGVMKELSFCAVPKWFDAPVLRAMIGCDDDTSQSYIRKLKKVPYVTPRITGTGYIIHERCRRALLSNLMRDDEKMFSEWSKRCYEYLRDDIIREFESIYHLMAFDEKEALLKYNSLRYNFSQLKRIDLMEGLQAELEATLKINPKISSHCQNWIKYGGAAIYHQTGGYDLALEMYDQLLQYPALDLFLQARINRAKGDILFWHRGGKDRKALAQESYLKAVGIWASLLKKKTVSPGVNKDDTPKSLAETHLALARIEEIQGSLIKGMKHFHSALEAYKRCEKLGPSYSEALRMMARNLRLQGKWKEAHLHFNEAEKAQKDLLGDIQLGMRTEEIKEMIQNVRNARAALWKEEGKWREAKTSLRKVINFHDNIPEKERNKEALGIALIDFGDVLRLEGNILKAKSIYAQAQESLSKSEVNKGYPLLGFAEIAIVEGMKEKALEYLTDATKAFSEFTYTRKLLEVALCQAKLDRDSDLRKAIKNLEKTYKMSNSADNAYTRSAILVELTEMIYDADGDTQRYRDYHRAAITLAGQEHGMFNDHLSMLHFLGGCIAGKENPVHAIPEFIVALSCAVRHNKLTLKRLLSQEVNWLRNPSKGGTEPITRKVEKNNIEAKALIRRYERAAMLDLPGESRIALKGAVGELRRSLVSIFQG